MPVQLTSPSSVAASAALPATYLMTYASVGHVGSALLRSFLGLACLPDFGNIVEQTPACSDVTGNRRKEVIAARLAET